MDVTNAFNLIFDFIKDVFVFSFNTLDSISFRGITILDLFITLIVISISLPILLTVLNTPRDYMEYSKRQAPKRNYEKSRVKKLNKKKGND